MNLKDLKEILQILDEKEITEFELEEEGMKLRIRKAAPSSNHAFPPVVGAPPVLSAPGPTSVPPASVPATAALAPAASPAAADELAGLTLVKSPMVGTFYRSPDPNSPAFVNPGDRVRVGQVVCIIEAMKLMNEIEAEVAGEVVRIHRENGQPVQYGDPLFSIRAER